jgi:hypothetical protein
MLFLLSNVTIIQYSSMLKKLNPNFAILLSTILWGTWWLPLRLMNEYASNNAIPLFLELYDSWADSISFFNTEYPSFY